ncbi:hypothetical protein [Egicoccus sp. AB-alg2]|uniref:hypothetical protein n=1 Tax=Egicoccus sp. AB-alg2 TaxID=3242693 RepID=UPI00359D4FF3
MRCSTRLLGAYERRILELQGDLEEAEAFVDPVRAKRARVELDQLVAGLSAATTLGGRAGAAAGRPSVPARPSPGGSAPLSGGSPPYTRPSATT